MPTITLTSTFTPTSTLTPTPVFTPTPAPISLENVNGIGLIKRVSGDTKDVYRSYNSVAFSRDLSTYATTYDDKTLILWNATTGQQVNTITTDAAIGIAGVLFSPDDKTILIQEGTKFSLWDAATGLKLRDFRCGTAVDAAFLPDSKTLFTGSTLCDVTTGQIIQNYHCPSNSCFHVAVSPDGKIVASTSDLGFTNSGKHEIILSDTVTGKEIARFDGDVYPPRTDIFPLIALAFSPDGRTLASMDSRNNILIWEVATGNLLSKFDPITKKAGIQSSEATRTQWSTHSLVFSPDGKLLASGHVYGSIILWDIASARPIYVIPSQLPLGYSADGDGESILSISFSKDGTLLIATNRKNTGMIWAPTSDVQMHSVTQTPSVAPGKIIVDATGSFPATTNFSEASKGDTYPISADKGSFSIVLNTDNNSIICFLVWQVRPSSDPKGQTSMYGDSNIVGPFTIDQPGDYVISVGRARNTDQCQAFSYTLKVTQP